MSIFSEEKRKTYARRIRNFWEEYKATKVGIVGLALLLIFVGVAAFGPWMTPYDPVLDKGLAEAFAMPGWIKFFPGYEEYPPTMSIPLVWTIEEVPFPLEYGREVAIRYTGQKVETIEIELTSNFHYDYIPPESFNVRLILDTQNIKDLSYFINLYVTTPNGNTTRLWSYFGDIERHRIVGIESTDWEVMKPLGYEPGVDNMASTILAERGTYEVALHITLMAASDRSTINLFVEEARFNIPGLVHGILGADYQGRDLYSQLIAGARISLQIGLLCAVISTVLGILIGTLAGYLGGVVDEVSMRIVDVLLCLPVLPLLLALIFIFEPSVMWIVVLIAIFGWQGLSRLIRSKILSLREAPFVECARASGASKTYIMLRHLIPNVLPVAFASLVLSVPGAILTEASLSFLGFGDPRAPTWGKMLHIAYEAGAFSSMAWWWILPPGLAITLVCLSFVFMGHAVDNVVNPRLRRRR